MGWIQAIILVTTVAQASVLHKRDEQHRVRHAVADGSSAAAPPSSIASSNRVTRPDDTIVPLQTSAVSATTLPTLVTMTDSIGETLISDGSGAVTIPTGLSHSTFVTLKDGSTITFKPTTRLSSSSIDTGVITTTNAAGKTVISETSQPRSSITSAASSKTPLGAIFPVTTSVAAPKATNGGTVVPCNLWFFNLCLKFGDISIGGWEFNLPPGVRPPGPPPAITFPPSLSISVGIRGTLPKWPAITVGPDRLPTYEPKPSDGPDNGCKTESAEVCFTSTSFGVDSETVTTTSSVFSSCTTVLGCGVSDSASSTATTSTSSGYPYSCTFGCTACVGRRSAPTSTATKSSADLFAYVWNSTLAKRDIPYSRNPDFEVVDDFYNAVIASSDSTKVPHINVGMTGISTSLFKPFDTSEFNFYVDGLEGCTSVVVISRLGAYITHFWEQSFTAPPGTVVNFQGDVIDYFKYVKDNGRPGGEPNTQPLAAVVGNGVFGDTDTTKIFIMTPATYDLDLDKFSTGQDQFTSITNGDNQPLFDGTTLTPPVPDRLTPIRDTLGQLMPGVPISQFTYRRQTISKRLDNGPYGKAMILYSNNQVKDPNTGAALNPPQKAVWQCWMQGKLMGSDLWDALPGQTGSCDGNQKRDADGSCRSPTPSTSVVSSTTITSQAGTPTGTPVSINTSDLPTLSPTGVSAPSGQSCASTVTQTQCALGANPSETACVSSTVCASFVSTSTSSTAATIPTIYASVDIFSDSGCSDFVGQVNLLLDKCYSPPSSFKCFKIGDVSSVAQTTAEIVAFKEKGCFADNDSDRLVYSNLRNSGDTYHHDITMDSLSLASLGSF